MSLTFLRRSTRVRGIWHAVKGNALFGITRSREPLSAHSDMPFSSIFTFNSLSKKCLFTFHYPLSLMDYQEMNPAKLFLISASGVGRLREILGEENKSSFGRWVQAQTFTFCAERLLSDRLTRQPLFRGVRAGRTCCLIDCTADVTCTGLGGRSCTAAQNRGYGISWKRNDEVWER